MAEICCGVVSEGNNPVLSSSCESKSSRLARRRRMEIRRFKYVAGVPTSSTDDSETSDATKRQRMEFENTSVFPLEFANAVDNCVSDKRVRKMMINAAASGDDSGHEVKDKDINKSSSQIPSIHQSSSSRTFDDIVDGFKNVAKFGVASVCGRRRDMEDAVSVHPSFLQSSEDSDASETHYFGVYDGHGCSHVAMRCREKLHELVKEELVVPPVGEPKWKIAMEKSFSKMDKEVIACNEGVFGNCRCELQTPECDTVGSTAVVAIVTPYKIVVANCGDSRAVLCRNGKPFPLSSDHKPDRPDELNRIEETGGRVIYWDGPRVLGVLAMSRAIGDNYLKPYVSCEPEVTITDRSPDDECLILASDGLWDVVSNDTACGVARMCLRGKVPPTTTLAPEVEEIAGVGEGMADKACSDASMLLTKLALARRSADNVSVVVVDLRKGT